MILVLILRLKTNYYWGIVNDMHFKTLKTRIISAFILLIAFFAAFTMYNYIVNSSMEKKAEELINIQLEMLTANQTLATSVTVRAAATTNYITTKQDSYLAIFQNYSEIANEQIAFLDKIDPYGVEKRAAYVAEGQKWREDVETKVLKEQQNGNTEVAIQNLLELNDQATVVRKGYDSLVAENVERIDVLGKDVIESTTSSKITGLVISIIILVFGIMIAIFTANSISKPIQQISNRLQTMSDGDLSTPFESTRKDELGTLMNSSDILTNKMQTMIGSIQIVAENVASNSEELAQSANEVKNGSESIAITMHDISEGMELQSSRTSNLVDVVDVFKSNVSNASKEGQSLLELSNEVQQLTLSGKGMMTTATSQMNTIDTIVQDAVAKVESLNNQSTQITSLVSVINDIANQTNLLALNAAIEAARAGEHGKGFAVVADEVRKLAEQVQFSVNDISKIVDTIQQETMNVTTSLHNGYNEVKKGTEEMNLTNVTFDEISKAVTNMRENVATIANTLSEIDSNTITINASVDEIATVTEQAAAGIQQTSATVQETSSTMEEIAGSTEQLAQMVEQLNSEVQNFKI